ERDLRQLRRLARPGLAADDRDRVRAHRGGDLVAARRDGQRFGKLDRRHARAAGNGRHGAGRLFPLDHPCVATRRASPTCRGPRPSSRVSDCPRRAAAFTTVTDSTWRQPLKTTTPTAGAPRRRFLKNTATAVGAAGALATPMVSRAQTTSLRFQSTWPAKDIFHEYALDFAKKVNDMAGEIG